MGYDPGKGAGPPGWQPLLPPGISHEDIAAQDLQRGPEHLTGSLPGLPDRDAVQSSSGHRHLSVHIW